MFFIIFFNSFLVGVFVIFLGFFIFIYWEGVVVFVFICLIKCFCCNVMGFMIWIVILLGIFLFCKISCFLVVKCFVLFNKVFFVIFF